MPARSPLLSVAAAKTLDDLGKSIRAQRKRLGISATVAAEAAGMSRVTLYRIEKGEPAVTIGSYLNAMAALGLEMVAVPSDDAGSSQHDAPLDRTEWIPTRVRLADYPQLQQLAWHVHGTNALTPREALDIYERNARHINAPALTQQEQRLIKALRVALADDRSDV